MVKTDKNENFVLAGKKLEHLKPGAQPVIRISVSAYNALVDMANESVLSRQEVASKAILFAQEHVVYEREDKQ